MSLTSEGARQQAQAEGLTLLVADNKAGFFGVYLSNPGKPKPYQTQVSRGGKDMHLGCFATAEEAALCVARSPEGQAAAQKAAAAPPLTSEEARQQAQAEGLTLVVADNTTGYFGVYNVTNKFAARVWRGGKMVTLGRFATAEEAALHVVQSPEGQAAAARAAAAPRFTSEEVRQQAQAEGLTLRVAANTTGYFGVRLCKRESKRGKPYEAQMRHGGKQMNLGCFATAEEAALCLARTPEVQAAGERAAAAPPPTPALTSEEARQQAQAEGLTLTVAESKTGYFGVRFDKRSGRSKPYQVQVRRGGKSVHLGYFVTAEEAALCVARTPEGRAAAAVEKVAAAPPLRSEEAQQQARDAIIEAVALDIIYEAAGAAAAELSAEVAAEVMAGIAMGL